MQFFSLTLVYLTCFVGTIAAFKNSAHTYVKNRFDGPEQVDKSPWLYKSFHDVDERIATSFKEHELDQNAKVFFFYFQIKKSEWYSKSRKINDWLVPIYNVVYPEKSPINFKEFESRGVLPKLLTGDAIDEWLERVIFEDDYVFQIVPDSFLEGSDKDAVSDVEDKLEKFYASDSKSTRKEKNEDVSVEQEVDADFAEANRLAAEEDQPVTILEDVPSNTTTVKHDNIFTNYQFFTNGIWSGLIVSGFLLLILYGALTWLSDLQISYTSFEKQVDFDKKNE
ncbi:hypothetical protein I9W82_003001 [Candida metapsilosis]|uniref:Protein BIG1 n=1 Tax=Candida metapsilosis TaxID=273372 RepID=A0A8H7ZFK3_9ASCO|nr:hypothetical protein I9W82_003001 [Candida metapsilosis]